MNLVDIVKIKYPQAILNNQVLFRKLDDDSIIIVDWNVPNIHKPDEQTLLDEADSLQTEYQKMILEEQVTPIMVSLIENTAKSKGYDSSLSCASYLNSSNNTWSNEAQSFISWRDSCYQYVYQILNNIEQGQPIPSQQDFINGIPIIQW